ncbi:hypothetical protein BKA56DRAFT_671904 [Ilyonectria sp. MPI-CAGE-AT-0026]|nr:hypothetical protein BKA56DRAFT_671904 [Ilyonectria sp. MPI-CAGE-AT-0026]
MNRHQECTYNRFLDHVDDQEMFTSPEDPEHHQQESPPTTESDPDLDTQQNSSNADPLPSFTPLSESDTSIGVLQETQPFFPLDQPLDPSLMQTESTDFQLLTWVPEGLWNVYDMISHPACRPSPSPMSPLKLSFLAKFTSTRGIANSFDCGSSTERKQLMLALTPAAPNDLLTPEINDDLGLRGSQLQCDFTLEQDMHLTDFEHTATSTNWVEWGKDYSPRDPVQESALFQCIGGLREDSIHPLELKMHEIVLGIQEHWQVSSIDSASSPGWTSMTMMLCYRFFSPVNLDRYLVSFWSFWHPNWPVFHKPTFVAAQNPAPLLVAMALIGACLTTNETDRNHAMFWIAAVEEWVFSDANFSEDPIPETDKGFDEVTVRLRLNAIRAAYCVVLLHSWEGGEDQKRRARRTRFTQVIAVARSLPLSIAIHGDLQRYTSIVDMHRNWRNFILKEELIRTVTYVFLLDMGYVIFNNTPPRMVIFELDIGLTCPEPCFQATDAEKWIFSVKAWSETYVGQRQPSMSNMMEAVMKEMPTQEEWKMLKQMSSLNFFTLASAFHSLIFHHHGGPTCWNQASPIRHALKNWRQAWLSRELLGSLQELEHAVLFDAWRKIGFMRYAMEFWCLGCIVYKRAEYMRSLRRDSNQGQRGTFKKGFLEVYDNSDMEQVHELMLRFHEMNFGVDIL